MLTYDSVYLGMSDRPEQLLLKYGNRHGLVTGATGSGKTVTLQTMAEGFSRAGVPVFCSDIKGDLSGLAIAGTSNPRVEERNEKIGLHTAYEAFPVILWDLFGKRGQPITTTIKSVGSLLMSAMLELNEVQTDVLNVVFKYAEEKRARLDTLDDLRVFLNHCTEEASELSKNYGRVSVITLTAILRSILQLENQGGATLFGPNHLNFADLMRTSDDGRGYISILAADELMSAPKFYAAFMLWMLSALYDTMPEVGDLDKPKLVFFFDEAHLLFTDAPKSLMNKVEQIVRLIRSKGVGVYFVTQTPADVPDTVLAQLGNRVQHALRSYTPKDLKGVKVAADTFRPNPAFKTFDVITQLGTGEALVSMLEDGGVPSIVGRTLIAPPSSRIGPLTDTERREVIKASPVVKKSIFGSTPKRAKIAPSSNEGKNFVGNLLTAVFGR